MEMPNEMSTPTYFIYREIPPNGDPFDATAPPVFFPAKDSDELFDALRIKYPHVKTHSERMRDAVIEFLLEERQTESLSTTTSPTMPSLYDSTAAASPWQHSWPSVSSTTLSSPETMAMGTPSFEDSPRPQHPQLARHMSAATASTASPPVLETMTSVFSLSTSEQPKQRVRRKMTESEKVEYRKRRIVKACEKCSKRKRKCNHNAPEMESATSGKTASKVAKPRAAATNTKIAKPQRAHEASASFASFDFQTLDFTPMEGFEDFTLMLDDPMPELTFDDFLDMEQHQVPTHVNATLPVDHFPWDNTQFWTPIHPMDFDDKGFDDDLSGLNSPPQPSLDGPLDIINGLPRPHNTLLSNATRSDLDMSHASNHNQLETVSPLDTHGNRNTHHASQETPLQASPSTSMLWEHLHTGQVEPTHTAHVHNALAQDDISPFRPGYAPGGSLRPQSSLSQAVTSLVGTAKAVRAFSDMLSRDHQEVPMVKIAGLIGLASLRTRAGIVSVSATNDRLSQQAPIREERVHDGRAENLHLNTIGSQQGSNSIRANSKFQSKLDMITQCIGPDGSRTRSDSAIISSSELASTSALVSTRSTHVSSGPCEGRSAAPSSISGGSQAPAVEETALNALGFTKSHPSGETAFAMTPISRGEVASTSALTSHGSLFDEEPTPQGWSSSAPGSGVDNTRPSTEMYRLKRRLPRALHSIVSKNRVEEGLADNSSAVAHSVAVRDEGLDARLLQAGVERPNYSGSSSFTIGKRVANRAASPENAAGDCTIIDTPARTAGTRLGLNAFASTLQQGRTTEEVGLKAAQHLFSESDTRRYRDHHGRTSVIASPVVHNHSAVLQLAALIAALAFVSIVLATGSTFVDPSFLFLALVCPVAGIKGGHGSERLWKNWHRAGARTRHTQTDIVECSEENSEWLAKLPLEAVETCFSFTVVADVDAGRGAWSRAEAGWR